jgi:SAM-dependent methyltransferase
MRSSSLDPRPDDEEPDDDRTPPASASTLLEDVAFDRIYPPAIRALSRRHWTPVSIGCRVAELFRKAGARRVLDVGAGVGKFALVAATAEPALDFVGVERRARLVRIARIAAFQLGIGNALFLEGDATTARWHDFDGLYFFNPLAENLFGRPDRIDNDVELSSSRFVREVLRVEEALRVAPTGTVVVTYHGTSTRVPTSYEVAHAERAGSDWLRVWTKARDSDDGSLFVDVGDEIVRWRPDAAG